MQHDQIGWPWPVAHPGFSQGGPKQKLLYIVAMGVATTTYTTDSVRLSFETLKNVYGMTVQVHATTKKRKSYEFEKRKIILKVGNILF